MLTMAKKRAARKGFPIRLTKQRWLLVRMAGVYLDSKDEIDEDARAALNLIPDYSSGVSGVKTIRLKGNQVEGMRKLLEAASSFHYRHHGPTNSRYPSSDGKAITNAARKLAQIDTVTLMGDVVRHAELVA